MKRFGLNSGYIGVDRRRNETGIAPLQKAYLERIRGGNYIPVFPDPPSAAFLLDTNPGASVAYSLRRLSSTYAGSAIRVRRSSDNTEQDIGFSGGVLDTASLLSFCGAGDGYVTTWYDQSGFNLDVTQTTAAAQPQVCSSGSVILLNGVPSVQFDGSNDYLDGGNVLDIGTNSFTSFSLVNVNSSGNESCIYSKGELGVANNKYALFRQGSNLNSFLYTTDVDKSAVVGFPPPYTKLLTVKITRGNSNTLFSNGSQIATNSTVGNYTMNSAFEFLVGAYGGGFFTPTTFHLDGNISELIIYLSDQTANQTAIESNIDAYYNIY